MTGVPGTIRILIADDQRVVRDGLSMLVGLINGVEVVGTACDGAEAVRLAEAYHPNVVLMDLRMPGTDGITATADLRERLPATRVLVLTTYASQDAILPALQAGARGYLTKDASAEQIEDAIHAVHADQARGRTDIGTVSGASAAPLGSLTPMVVPLSFDPRRLAGQRLVQLALGRALHDPHASASRSARPPASSRSAATAAASSSAVSLRTLADHAF